MTTKECRLAALLLREASDVFCYHGCNDLDMDAIHSIGFNEREKMQLAAEYARWNGECAQDTVRAMANPRLGDDGFLSR